MVDFVRSLARAKARGEPPHLRVLTRQASRLRWATLLACSAARAFALSLLERRGGLCADGATPSCSEVITEGRYAGLSG